MHDEFLRQTIQLAEQRRGMTGTNPAVGAIVVKEGKILSEGMHWASGHAHAEVEALRKINEEVSRGATIYVSLEPCCFVGKTPACTELLLRRGISKVFYAFEDPNPKVAGQGAATLRASGAQVTHIPISEANAFYQSYAFWTLNQKPYVIAKLAMTLDGRTADTGGRPLKITGEEAARYTHEQRKRASAILSTASTVLADDPLLNVRLSETPVSKPLYLLDARLEIPRQAKVLKNTQVTIFHALAPAPADFPENVIFKALPVDSSGHFDLEQIFSQIGQAGHHELWVEAGDRLFFRLIEDRKVHKALIYVAPRFWGTRIGPGDNDPQTKLDLTKCGASIKWGNLGPDGLCEMTW